MGGSSNFISNLQDSSKHMGILLQEPPTGIITKFKARLCVRRDLQEDTPETYAPVVS